MIADDGLMVVVVVGVACGGESVWGEGVFSGEAACVVVVTAFAPETSISVGASWAVSISQPELMTTNIMRPIKTALFKSVHHHPVDI